MAFLGKLGVVGLAALAAADVVLVAFAVRHVDGQPVPMSEVVATPRSTPTPEPSTTPSTTPSRTSTPRTPPSASGARTLIDIGDDRALARATTGTCGKGGAKVELSLDGGETFSASDVPSAAVVLRIASIDADNAWLIATDADCKVVTTYTTTNGGGAWDATEGSDGSWHRLTKPGVRVHAPAGTADVPCAEDQVMTGFSTLSSDQAYALCGDGEVLSTLDGGQAWTERGKVPGAMDLDFVDRTHGIAAVVGDSDCAGIAIAATTDGGESWTSRTCVQTSAEGVPDVSADGQRAYLGVGTSVWFSDDGGTSWDERS